MSGRFGTIGIGVLAALAVAATALSGCNRDLESSTDVQDCNGSRYIVPSNRITGNGEGGGSCVLRNGVMPQPQEFD